MRFVTILIFFSFYSYAAPVYDFWGGNESNKRSKVQIKNTNLPKPDYLNENDTIQPNIDKEEVNLAEDLKDMSIKDRYLKYNQRGEKDPQVTKDTVQPNIAKDLDYSKTNLANDLKEISIKDKYLKFNLKGAKDPQLASDLDPEKIKLAPDYAEDKNSNKKRTQKSNSKATNSRNSRSSLDKISSNKTDYTDESLGYTNDYVVFYDEKNREKGFIDIIPYITIGNSLFVITDGDYSARVLDDGISASLAFDLGLNYIWDNVNIGYLWNINFGQYDFSEKDRTNPNAQSKGEISGYIISVMPTIFYELNRAQTMSVLVGYGAGGSYINLKGNATLANSNNETITNNIEVGNFYLSHGLLIEILHNNLMVSFTKVKIRIEEEGQNIKINENRLNIGYKFSF